ncbi:hypothetical protein SAMN06295905_0363 [Devosia lucknowensis]|uniref:HdeA/HdeB family protein n=1 Tax=Devosia lucknowensis TaxID=1096929 RepID=A0A1Y6ECM5_9HYPH|nr:hypothetical protein [Devosia lucknowensis]SMQ60328.1 hypothetical protein SAMN06295905_0363 [Devosia lucknowensis]
MRLHNVLRFVVAAAVVSSVGAVSAADLGGYYGGSCVSYRQSTLPMQPLDVVKQTVWANFESARDGMSNPSVQASRSPAFIWAMEARWACSAAVGYLDGGHLDEESVQKCDCFHARYVSFR